MTSLLVKKQVLPLPAIKRVLVKSYWLGINEMRLDASFYAEEVTVVERILKEMGYPLLDLGELTERIFYTSRSKRYYTNKAEGTPYLTSSEVQWFLPEPKYVLANELPNKEEWYAKEGWILLTRSGTVGLVTLVSRDMEKYLLSEHMIRMVPKPDTLTGYLYAYLSSWFGQTYITKSIFGGVVEEIEPHHVQSIPVPRLPKEVQKAIHNNMLKVSNMREKARQLMNSAERLLYKEIGLTELELKVNRRSFTVNSYRLKLRFDASYHDPVLRIINNKLCNARWPLKRLDDKEVSRKIFIPNRFKRIYVQKEFGVPFLSGTNILQTKPHSLKYLSKRTHNLENYILKEGMILVAARGTIGRIMPITKSIDGWAASDNIARIVPNEVNSGFLACFLNTMYGQAQLIGQTAGSIVNLIEPQHIAEVQIPIPPKDVQKAIGNLIVEAYELKELSNKTEDETVKTLETMFEEHRMTEVNEEYLKEINAYVDSFELIGNEQFRKSREELESGRTISFDEFKKEHGFNV
jgi:type I restriction enzyme S subunit